MRRDEKRSRPWLWALVLVGFFFASLWPAGSSANHRHAAGKRGDLHSAAHHKKHGGQGERSGGRKVKKPHGAKSQKSAVHGTKKGKSAAHRPKKGKKAQAGQKRRKSGRKPAAVKAAHGQSRVGFFTAYTSRGRGKRAKHPHITSDQTNLKKTDSCVVANNRLPIGTRIAIEGVGVCEVHDRLSKRAKADHFDIYMKSGPKLAREFGKRKLKYTIADCLLVSGSPFLCERRSENV